MPDVILGVGALAVGRLVEASRTVPIVFTQVIDPVGSGFVDSLSRPGGNVTGFARFEYGLSAKWLELLKEMAPSVMHVEVIRDPTTAPGIGQWAAIQTVARSFGVELRPLSIRDPAEIDRAIGVFAQYPNSGLIVTESAPAIVHRDLIVRLASHHKLPAVYADRFFVDAGGLMSYGTDTVDQNRRAAAYVDRILKGERPSDLPVQEPTKYQLVINLKTAKALDLSVPPTLLARADEVIE
jgi:putative tryptophan/tyrosine transport system substrate-binding protein